MSDQVRNDDQNVLRLGLEDLQKRIAVVLGVEGSTEEKHLEIIDQTTDAILKKIFLDTLEKLSDQDKEEYAKLIEVEASPEYINKYLNTKIPGYDEFTKKIIDDFLSELKEERQEEAATIYKGEAYTLTFHFDNPGSSGTVTLDWRDGGEEETFTFSGREISIRHVYTMAGRFKITFCVTENQGRVTKGTNTVTVLVPTPGSIKDKITEMYNAGTITKLARSLYDKLTQAQSQIDDGNYPQARNILRALVDQIKAQLDISSDPGSVLIAQVEYLMDSFPKSLDKFERLLEIHKVFGNIVFSDLPGYIRRELEEIMAETEVVDVVSLLQKDLKYQELARELPPDKFERLMEILDAYETSDSLPAEAREEVDDILRISLEVRLMTVVPTPKLINVLRSYGAKI